MMITNPFEQKYELLDLIGEGGFGDVHICKQRNTGFLCAAKVTGSYNAWGEDFKSEEEAAQFVHELWAREVRVLQTFSHPSIPKYHDHFAWRDERLNVDQYAIVEELRLGENTGKYLEQKKKLPEEDVWRILCDVGEVLTLFHSKEFVHGDMKPHNILIHPSYISLLDFDAAAKTSEPYTGFFTERFEAPETLDDEILPESDWYSLGVSAYSLVSGKRPLKNILRRRARIQDTLYGLTKKKDVSGRLYEIIDTLTHPDPKRRRTAIKRIVG